MDVYAEANRKSYTKIVINEEKIIALKMQLNLQLWKEVSLNAWKYSVLHSSVKTYEIHVLVILSSSIPRV